MIKAGFIVGNFQLDQAYKILLQKSQATKGGKKNQKQRNKTKTTPTKPLCIQ